jgi:hypothetical protein
VCVTTPLPEPALGQLLLQTNLLERLGGTQIVRDEGHFGDESDPYPTFELLERLVATPGAERAS